MSRVFVSGDMASVALGADEVADALAAAGAQVVLAARSAQEIEAGAAAIRATGARAEALRLDVADLEAGPGLIAQAGPFDILVNNAGTNRPMPMTQVTPQDYDAVLDLNVRAAFFVAQAVAKALIAAGHPGSLIHMSSQMGHVGGPQRSLYCASKWAVEGMSKAFALDLAGHRIRSNTIAPTFIETPMTRPYMEDPDFRQSVMSKIKLGRLARVEDIMGAVVFLASDASAMVTGASMLVDGGWTAD